MAPFVSLSECCLRGSVLPGTPRGEMQRAGPDGLRVDRYYARPAGVLKHPKACVVLLYDIFGFQLDNPKILADTYADKLGLEVYVPDYIPNAVPADLLDSAINLYPGEKAGRGWLAAAWGKLSMLRILPYLRGILDGEACPLVDKAMDDLTDAGYTTIGAVGFCRGGTMITYLLAKGDASPLTAGAIFHPEYTPVRWPLFRRPAAFLLADEDQYIYGARVDEVRAAFGGPPNEVIQFKDTVHGFGARPALEHAGTMTAFQEANGAAEDFLRRTLGL